MKPEEKKKAIKLRKQGKTYSEILREVKVSKSTLSLWLRDVGLSKPQKQNISKKRMEAQKRGAKARRDERVRRTKEIHELARKEIGHLSKREKWLIGIALYWAEGSKQKKGQPSPRLDFTNSDGDMIKFFIVWLREYLNISSEDFKFGIYIHENNKYRIDEVIRYWSKVTSFPKKKFDYVYYKKHNVKTNRKNVGEDYFGVLRVSIRKSIDLNRKIAGWMTGISQPL